MLPALLLAAVVVNESAVQNLLKGNPGLVTLPKGTIFVRSEIHVPAGFEVKGNPHGTVLRATADFQGRAILVCGSRVTISDVTLDGNREELQRAAELPSANQSFIEFYGRNGIIADQVRDLALRDLTLRNILNFGILASRSDGITVERVRVMDSGSLRQNGRNNTSGGILMEEGTRSFSVLDSSFIRIRGNGVWTHSRYQSPRNGPGRIAGNSFETIARDAVQVGHATTVIVERNSGRRIGWPTQEVDVEGGGTPVGIDTAGNVDKTIYRRNRFEEINGKCIDLDGFHDGEVRDNVCINRGKPGEYPFGHYGIVFNNSNPDMQSARIAVTGNVIDGTKYGGIFVIGRHHTITRNRLLRLNLARCGCPYDPKQPDLLRSGIYLGARAERPDPASDNVIEDNVVEGHGMQSYCITAAPGVRRRDQQIARNDCRNSNSL